MSEDEDTKTEISEEINLKDLKLSVGEVNPPEEAKITFNEQTGKVTKPDLGKARKTWFNSAKQQAKTQQRTKQVFANSKALDRNISLNINKKKR
jgi:hypothetical protein